MKFFLACIVLVIAVNYTSAFCERSLPKAVPYKWSSKFFVYCEYHGMKFLDGSKWIDADRCMRCSCDGGLECCGIGYFAGKVDVPGCTAVRDQCDLVLLNNEQTALCKK